MGGVLGDLGRPLTSGIEIPSLPQVPWSSSLVCFEIRSQASLAALSNSLNLLVPEDDLELLILPFLPLECLGSQGCSIIIRFTGSRAWAYQQQHSEQGNRLSVPREDCRDTGATLGRCQAPLGEESSAFQSPEVGVRVRGEAVGQDKEVCGALELQA